MKKIISSLFGKAILLILGLALSSLVSTAQCRFLNENFNVNPVLSPTDVNNTWYPDRYRPSAFVSDVFMGNNVLKISIDGPGDGALSRPSGLQGTFYNTQGRKFNQCGGCVTRSKADLYIPADWATKHRRSDMWATAWDGVDMVYPSSYPIIGFRNPDAVSPGIYYWDNSSGWVNSGIAVAYNSWYTLEFRLVSGDVVYYVNNLPIAVTPGYGSLYLSDVMMQAYNFNDPALPAANQNADSYDAYWDNLVTSTTNGNVVINSNTNEYFCSIQSAINASNTLNGHTISVGPGTYYEDVLINKQLTLNGAGIGVTKVSGPIGGPGSTMFVQAPGVVINGFSITREGNNVAQWNLALNSAGVSVQSQGNYAEIKNCHFYGNRTGIDINNSNGNNVHNNIIDNNRTGLLFRNQVDNTNLQNNFITNNWTIGVLFIDGSGGSNTPPQTATNSTFNNNDISGNWYAQIEDRQVGGALPPPGSNPKNFTCNWYGSTNPSLSLAQGGEPGYAAQIPVVYGGAATAPGGQPDIKGLASANFVYVPYLSSGTDASPAIGFQPSVLCTSCPTTACTITVNPSPALAGHAPNTIYRGYGPSSVVLTAEAGVSYLWSTAETTQSITVSPTATTTYTVTMKYTNGCTSTCTITITVIDVRCGNKNDKVIVCHNGKENCISPNAVPAHLAHGDMLGNCPANFVSVPGPLPEDEKSIDKEKEFKVIISPNPTMSVFSIQVNSESREPINIRIMDATGMVKTTLVNISRGAKVTMGSDLRGGTYYAEITQGNNRQVVRLVKLN